LSRKTRGFSLIEGVALASFFLMRMPGEGQEIFVSIQPTMKMTMPKRVFLKRYPMLPSLTDESMRTKRIKRSPEPCTAFAT